MMANQCHFNLTRIDFEIFLPADLAAKAEDIASRIKSVQQKSGSRRVRARVVYQPRRELLSIKVEGIEPADIDADDSVGGAEQAVNEFRDCVEKLVAEAQSVALQKLGLMA